jgi:hypothetical protein
MKEERRRRCNGLTCLKAILNAVATVDHRPTAPTA